MSRKLGLVALLVVAGSTKPLAPLPQTAHAARDAIPITIRQAESTTPSVTAEPGSAIPSGILPTGIIDEAIVAVASEGDGDEPAMTASSCSLVSLEPSAASALGGVIVNVGPQVSSLLPRCQCGTAILGIEYTLGKDGQSTFYCAAEGAQETEAVSTATASGAIGDPSNAAWAQVSC